jgi:xanthine dehydrogenase accessory factor
MRLRLALTGADAAVVMTHQFERDREWLRWLLQMNLKYVGALGPRRRTVRLLGGQEPPDGLRAPVGLPIGAEGPDEIAISIVADLIRAHRNPSAAGEGFS